MTKQNTNKLFFNLKWNYLGISLLENGDLLAVDHQVLSIGGDAALEAAVGGIKLEEVYHVVDVEERIVDGHHVGSTFNGGPEDQAADPAETVDSNFHHLDLVSET